MEEKLIRILIVEDNPGDARLIQEFLKDAKAVQFDTVHVERLADAIGKLDDEHFDVPLLDLRLPDSQGIGTFDRIHEKAPRIPVVVLTGLVDETIAVSAVTHGAQDYLVKGQVDGDDLARSIRYAIARQSTQAEAVTEPTSRSRGRVLAFIGAKGGSGTTTVALNVAGAIAKLGKSVIAAELRSCYGTFSTQLARTPTGGVADLLTLDPQAIDERQISHNLANLAFKVRVLFGPQTPEEFGEMTPQHAETLTERLADMADFVVIDLPCHPCPESRATLAHCDSVVLVVERESSAIASAKVMFDLLKSWDIATKQIGLAFVNRSGSATTANPRELSAQLGCGVIGAVVQATESCTDAMRTGVPLTVAEPDSAAAASFSDIAARLSADVVSPTIF